MDLVIASPHCATILDVRSHPTHGWTGQRPDQRSVISRQPIQEGAAVRAEAPTEGRCDRAEVRLLVNKDAYSPCLEAIDVCRLNRALRMESTRLAAVFDIDTEDHPFRALPFARIVSVWRELADAREDDRIGRCRTRLRSAHLVIIRIAELELMDTQSATRRRDERSRCRIAAAQTGATQRVEHTLRSRRVEVHIERVPFVATAAKVAVMLPLAADAEIPENRTAIHLAERRAQLATVRDVLDLQPGSPDARDCYRGHGDARLIDIAVIQIAATRYPAGHRQDAVH